MSCRSSRTVWRRAAATCVVCTQPCSALVAPATTTTTTLGSIHPLASMEPTPPVCKGRPATAVLPLPLCRTRSRRAAALCPRRPLPMAQGRVATHEGRPADCCGVMLQSDACVLPKSCEDQGGGPARPCQAPARPLPGPGQAPGQALHAHLRKRLARSAPGMSPSAAAPVPSSGRTPGMATACAPPAWTAAASVVTGIGGRVD